MRSVIACINFHNSLDMAAAGCLPEGVNYCSS